MWDADSMTSPDDPALPFPIRAGRYDVSPGLRPLAGEAIGVAPRLFRFDSAFSQHRRNKDACRTEPCPNKYVVTDADGFSPAIAGIAQSAKAADPRLSQPTTMPS